MARVHVYEAPRGLALDAFVGTTGDAGRERFISIIARPSARSMHPIAVDVMKALGANRDLYSKKQSMSALLQCASAWSLARGLTDLYIGEAQDLEGHLYDCVDLAENAGLDLHLVYGFGQVHAHGSPLKEASVEHHEFGRLPPVLLGHKVRRPVTPEDALPTPPDEPWMTFRAVYTEALSPAQVERCDYVYLKAYALARASAAADKEGVSRLLGEVWSACGVDDARRLVALRAVQAALFRGNLNLNADLRLATRHAMRHNLTALIDVHYDRMRSYADPWRAAATVLHAHHVTPARMCALRTHDVAHDGRIMGLRVDLPDGGLQVLVAQRWRRLLDDEVDAHLFPMEEMKLKRGIRAFAKELELPVITDWISQGTDRDDRLSGLRLEEIS